MHTERNANAFMLILIVYAFAASFLLGLILLFFGTPPTSTLLVLVQLFTFGVPCVAMLILKRAAWREMFPLRRIGGANILFVVSLMLLAQPFMMFLSGLSMLLFNNEIAATVEGMASESGLLVTLLVVGVVPSVLEEATFRGIILSGYRHASPLVAALVNGLFFGIIHLDPQQFLYAFAMGAVFASMVYYTRSLLSGMLAHATVNCTQVILSHFSAQAAEAEVMPEGLSPLMQSVMEWMLANQVLYSMLVMLLFSLFTIPVFVLLFRLFKRHNERRNALLPIAADAPPEDEPSARKPFNWMLWSIVGIYIVYVMVTFVFTRLA